MKQQTLVGYFLRLSIATVFLYAAVGAYLQPYNWIGFIPQVAEKIAPAQTLLTGFSLFQLFLAVWVLTGWKQLFSALVASVTLLAIIVANWGDLTVLFRDFAIFFASLALATSAYKK